MQNLKESKMSSDSDSESSVNSVELSSESDCSEDEMSVLTFVRGCCPYEDEPLAISSEQVEDQEQDVDEDGLTPAILEKRFLKEIVLEEW